MPTQAERRQATRIAILVAARALFGSKGFAHVTIDDIAGLAGVTKGGIYHHFSSKDALFGDVLMAEQARLASAAVASAEGDIVELFTDAVRRYLLAAAAPVTRQILLIDGPAVLGWAKWREIDERVFGQVVRQAIGRIRGDDTLDAELAALSMLVLGAVMEAAMGCAASSDPDQLAHQAAAALRLLLLGLKDRPADAERVSWQSPATPAPP